MTQDSAINDRAPRDTETLDLSVCIVNWNRGDLLEQCLCSIYGTRQAVSFEVIVVDNGSSDDSAGMVERCYPQVVLIKNDNNRGFASANNQALQISNGRYCLLLNNDTQILDDSFSSMIRFMDHHPDAGMATCKIYNPVTKRAETGAGSEAPLTPTVVFWNDLISLTGLHRLFPGNQWLQRCLWTGRDSPRARRVSHISGSCMMARKAAIDKVGLLDERFFMFLEETDWCYRFQSAGWHIYYIPDTTIIHLGGGSTRLRMDRNLLYYQSLCKFFKKHYGFLAMAQYRIQEALLFTPLRTVRKWFGLLRY